MAARSAGLVFEYSGIFDAAAAKAGMAASWNFTLEMSNDSPVLVIQCVDAASVVGSGVAAGAEHPANVNAAITASPPIFLMPES